MVDELSRELAAFGENVIVVSPYYECNKRGETGYLKADGFTWLYNLDVYSGSEHQVIGVHGGVYGNIQYYFLHNSYLFPKIYAG